jgi:Kef-type K+ transport system membrane component KefB/CBS domain-containing protein
MMEFWDTILDNISIYHLNFLFLLGLALFGGTLGGKIFQKMKIPQVVGYIIIGIVIGQTGIKIIDRNIIETLKPFNYFALGLIGFMIGGELKKEIFIRYGKQFIYILFFEGMTAFVVVTLAVGIIGSLFIENSAIAWAIALLLGSISSATAPAATTDVLWEYKTKGPLTRTILGIVALDDGLALILFAIASSIASILIGNRDVSFTHSIIHTVYEIGGSVLIGVVSGLILSRIIKRYVEEEKILAFSIGVVLLVLGISIAIDTDMLLGAMALGATVANYSPRKSKEIFKLVEKFTPPIFVLFFVLVGANLNVKSMTLPLIVFTFTYFIARSGGKMLGANFGSRISKAPETVGKYLPLCLFSQAGVAIGLSILAGQRFMGETGQTIVITVTASTFVVQLIGPSMVKLAVEKAKEIGLNVTEEDLIRRSQAKDILDDSIPFINENAPLKEVLEIFSKYDNLHYPVVDDRMKILGIITIDNIKNTFISSELGDFLLAHDLMDSVIYTASPETPLIEVNDILKKNNIDYLPIVTDENKLLGILETRNIQKLISRRIMELQNHADLLG